MPSVPTLGVVYPTARFAEPCVELAGFLGGHRGQSLPGGLRVAKRVLRGPLTVFVLRAAPHGVGSEGLAQPGGELFGG